MLYQINEVEFDFDDEDHQNMTTDEMSIIEDSVINTTWEVDFEDELSDAITDATGWCIKSIDYSEVSK